MVLRPLCPNPGPVGFSLERLEAGALQSCISLSKKTIPLTHSSAASVTGRILLGKGRTLHLRRRAPHSQLKVTWPLRRRALAQASSMQSVEPAKPVCTFQAVRRQDSGSVLRTVLLFRVHPSHTLPGLTPRACFSNYHRSLPQLQEKGCDCLLPPLLPPKASHQDSQSRLQSSASPPWLCSGTAP